jgi:threonine-phosphate decarboxylase
MGARHTVAHGALDHAELAARGLRPEALLDFSSNLNPFGPPPGVGAALAALDPAPYPDRSCLRLREAIARQHDREIGQVLPGNGSNELIHLLARALLRPGDTTLVIGPTFGEYAYAGQLAGARLVEWRACAERGFAIDLDALLAQMSHLRPRLAWLCAPNNPTGVDLPTEAVRAIAEACAAGDGFLVVDRTYTAFLREPYSLEPIRPGEMPALLELYSFTKSYAIAGLRLGYLLGDADLLARVAAFQPTWSVSSAAQAAGMAALADEEFLSRTLPRLWSASGALCDGLRRLDLPVWRGALPFMLVRTGDGAATRAALLERGCVVRDCASFGLAEWVRVAPRLPEDNVWLLRMWAEAIDDKMTR